MANIDGREEKANFRVRFYNAGGDWTSNLRDKFIRMKHKIENTKQIADLASMLAVSSTESTLRARMDK
ncbi:CLUMA_CG020025, isoform A [Clunio marinus]|uniref:CLUMA_CG020025, isoform A n=1 Tax=Clunio marinus TaxID=568069 RepID=A0A1J1J3L2_9DIPT|nr:CLUMA_CG020025, isoform A [Clunio marinus]